MHTIKIVSLCFVLLICVFCIFACGPDVSADEPAILSHEYFKNSIVRPSPEEVPAEATAKGVVLTCTKETVPSTFNIIHFQLSCVDGNEDGFYYNSSIIRLEQKQPDGSWKEIPYGQLQTLPGLFEEQEKPREWQYSKIGKASFTIDRDYILEEITAGRYRAIIFVGSEATPVCAYFTIE